ncbi:MAG: hypothetical protein AB7P76_04490 [Candidatus Melainabacteria bacterium]
MPIASNINSAFILPQQAAPQITKQHQEQIASALNGTLNQSGGPTHMCGFDSNG